MNYPLKTIIVEDNPDHLFNLEHFLMPYKKVISIQQRATTYEEAIFLLSNESFDLSLLDIELDNGMQCYDLLKRVNHDQFGIICFGTQSSSVNLEYSSSISGYLFLPKPYSTDGTSRFISQLQEKVKHRGVMNLAQSSYKDQIPLSLLTYSGILNIMPDNILMISVADKECRLTLYDNPNNSPEIKLRAALIDFEKTLNPLFFKRIGKNYLINIKRCHSYKDGIIILRNIARKEFIVEIKEGIAEFLALFNQIKK